MAKHTLNRIQAKSFAALLRQPGRHCDGGGLYLEVGQGNGTACWVLRYTINGRPEYMGLGSALKVSLAAARKAAIEPRELAALGKSPKQARDAAREAERAEREAQVTFWDYVLHVYDRHTTHLKGDGRQDWLDVLTQYAQPAIGAMPLRSVTKKDIVGLLLNGTQPLWLTKNATAAKVLANLRTVFRTAIEVEFKYTGANPAEIAPSSLPKLNKEVRSHPYLPFADVPALVAQLRTFQTDERYGQRALALEFILLTGLRFGTVQKMLWREVDFGRQTWTPSKAHMKAGNMHVCPLSDRAIAILRSLPQGAAGDRVFPDVNTSNEVAYLLQQRLGAKDGAGEPATTHGFRTTIKLWLKHGPEKASERLSEIVIAHVVDTQVSRAYQGGNSLEEVELRTDLEQRAPLMQAWADFCGSACQEDGGNVVKFRAA